MKSGKAREAVDGKAESFVEIERMTQPELIVDLYAQFQLSKIQIVPASEESFQVFVSTDGTKWDEILPSVVDDDGTLFQTSLLGRYIKVKGTSDHLAIGEVRAYGERMLPTLDQLDDLLEFAFGLDPETTDEDVITNFEEALQKAQDAAEREAEPDTINDVYWKLYDAIVDLGLNERVNLALNKETVATNDPDGHSEGMVDGNMSTNWNSGRLSITGKPYDHAQLIPAENIVDLGNLYQIEEIRVFYTNQNIWYQYELLGSVDGSEWITLGEKKTETTPNEAEDYHLIDNAKCRYIMLRNTNVQNGSDGRRENVNVSELQVYGIEISVDKSELREALQAAAALDCETYTANSWTALQDALAAAETIMADEDATQEQVDQAASALQSATDALQVKASASAIQALQNMVNKADALGSDDETLNAAIETAQALLNDPDNASVTAVVSALLNLSEAMQALNTDESTDALRADVQATIDFINEHILNDVEGLRPGKVQALRDAVKAAQDVVDDPDATADELKAANKAMTKAAQELWEIVTKAELNALIEAANGYLEGDYTTESLEALQAAITAAQAVANNDDATTAEVTDAITNLANAIAGLETIALDTSALEHEIELVSEMIANIGNYVPSTVEGLQDKLDAAKTVLGNATTQAEIDAATESLREARLNARTKADVSALEELIAYVNSLDLRAYTLDSVVPVNRMMSKLTQAMNDEEITQEKVDELAAEMQAAIDGLQPNVTPETGDTANGSTDTGSANTAAAIQTGMMLTLLAAAGVAVMILRRKRS